MVQVKGRKLWKNLILGIFSLFIILLFCIGTIYFLGKKQLSTIYHYDSQKIELSSELQSLERGRHLVEAVVGCADCHGENLAGRVIINDPVLGKVISPNITSGEGSVTKDYSIEDWIRILRHGVKKPGYGLLIMPAVPYSEMSQKDLSNVLSYVKSVTPVNQTMPPSKLGFLGYILLGLKKMQLGVQLVDHNKVFAAEPEIGLNKNYGEYLSRLSGCIDCHGGNYKGGPIAGAPPDVPPASDITAQKFASWSEEDFFKALRQGMKKDGSQINSFMPWRTYGRMTDDELKALWMFLANK